MLRILGIICDIFMVLSLVFSVLYGIFLFCWGLEVPMPLVFRDGMMHLTEPFVAGLRATFEVSYFRYKITKYHWFESTYGVLLVVSLLTFAAFALASSYFHRMDYKLKLWVQDLFHHLFLARTQAKSGVSLSPVSSAQPRVYTDASHSEFAAKNPKKKKPPVSGSPVVLVAIGFVYVDEYPMLEVEAQRKINEVPAIQRVYDQKNYVLIKFDSMMQATDYVQDFAFHFSQVKMMTRVDIERQPAYRVAFHCLSIKEHILEEEPFLNAMLHCVPHNQIFMSTEAKHQLDTESQQQVSNFPLKILPVGTFSKLGDRTFPEVYRLAFWNEGREQSG